MNDAITCEKCGYDLFMINPDGLTVCNQCGEFSTVPTAPPAIDRNPLTDEEMRRCAQAMDAEPLAEGWPELIKFARAIEAAHGIKEGK